MKTIMVIFSIIFLMSCAKTNKTEDEYINSLMNSKQYAKLIAFLQKKPENEKNRP